MTSAARRTPKPPTRIRDARGRRVEPLDPVELHLLRRHDVIAADDLRPIVDEVGSGLEERTRRFLPVLYVGVPLIGLVLVVQAVDLWLQGRFFDLFSARNIALFNVWFLILVLWTRAKRARFGRIRRVMLAHRRCPHCGYDLRGLAADATDGCTVCPECGCAWDPGGDVRPAGDAAGGP